MSSSLDFDNEIPDCLPSSNSTTAMLKQITEFVKKYDELSKSAKEFCVGPFARAMAVDYIHNLNTGECVGTQEKEDTKEIIDKILDFKESEKDSVKRETRNNYLGLKRMHELHTEMENTGLLTVDGICDVHALLLKGLKDDCGKIRITEVCTSWEGSLHFYPPPDRVESQFFSVVDQHNIHMESIQKMTLGDEKILFLFKSAAWLLFAFVDTHPFTDGNGRMCRLLANYVLSLMMPFPVALYHSKHKERSARNDYLNAIVECRKSSEKHPSRLCAMLIEGAWMGWRSFYSNLERREQAGVVPVFGPITIQQASGQVSERVVRVLPKGADVEGAVKAVQRVVDQADLAGLKSHQFLPMEVDVDGVTKIRVNIFPQKPAV